MKTQPPVLRNCYKETFRDLPNKQKQNVVNLTISIIIYSQLCDSWRLKLVCAVQNSEQPFKQYNSKGSESTGCTKSAGFGCVVGGFLGCGGFWFGFVLFLGVSCCLLCFWLVCFYDFFLLKHIPGPRFQLQCIFTTLT